jgi:alpha-ketoglutarate-dependent taurine dioxygenase
MRADWESEDLRRDRSWIFGFAPEHATHLAALARAQYSRGLDLLDYRKEDFPLGDAGAVFAAGLQEAREGRGIVLVKGLPADRLSEEEFRLLSWGIGLNFGVAVPQGKASQLISPVRDVGTTYRTGKGGRGYSSRSGLDFHNDGSDIAVLTCFRPARRGGQSTVVSSIRAHNTILRRAPDQARVLYEGFWFTRQGEEAPDERPVYATPIFAECGGELFVRYNRKNITFAQGLPGVSPLSESQSAALATLDELLASEQNAFNFDLEPGDIQIMNDYRVLHSRSEFEDFPEPERKRLLFRLWLSVPGSGALPPSWKGFYRSTRANSVRGGIRGQNYTERCRAYELRQAAALGMSPGE